MDRKRNFGVMYRFWLIAVPILAVSLIALVAVVGLVSCR
jgi:hypothetical protein